MSDPFYTLVKLLGRPVFRVASRPLVLHAERLDRAGGFIIAANHQSPYDVPILIRHARRHLDFVAIAEVFANPFSGWLYRRMNAVPLARVGEATAGGAIRTIVRRLERGRVVAMFPEGRLTPLAESVVSGGGIRGGIGRIARLARVPIIPVAIVGSEAFGGGWKRWLPLRSVRYGLSVGEAIAPDDGGGGNFREAADIAARLEAELKRSLAALHCELRAALAAARNDDPR